MCFSLFLARAPFEQSAEAGDWNAGERGLAALQRAEDFERSLEVTADYAARQSFLWGGFLKNRARGHRRAPVSRIISVEFV